MEQTFLKFYICITAVSNKIAIFVSFAYNVFGGGWGDEETNTSANITGNTNLSITGGQAMLTSYWSTTMRNWEPATIVGDKTYSPQYIPATQKYHRLFYHNLR